jgi:hypothetical protein
VRHDLTDEVTGAPRTAASDHAELLHVLEHLRPGELVNLATVWGEYEIEARCASYWVSEVQGDGSVVDLGLTVPYKGQVVALIEYGLTLLVEWRLAAPESTSRTLWRVRIMAGDEDQWPTVPSWDELHGMMQSDKRTGHYYWQVEPATACNSVHQRCGDSSRHGAAMEALLAAVLAGVDRWLLDRQREADEKHAAHADAYWRACEFRLTVDGKE